MLDGTSVRIAFGVMALTLLVLLCLMASSSGRTTYVTWWRRSMVTLMLSYGLFFFDGTSVQRYTNPIADLAIAAGAAMAWAGARSLRAERPPLWRLAAGPVVAFLCAVVDHPERSAWAGAWGFMAVVAAYCVLCAVDTWKAGRLMAQTVDDRSFEMLARALAVAFAVTATFYLARAGAVAVLGGDTRDFQEFFGPGVTSLVQIFLMTTVAFSMASLVTAQKMCELHLRASRDPLTGLLNRTEFLLQAQLRLAQSQVHASVVVLADLDRFKSVNDRFGHATGDRVLRAYAQACSGVLRAGDLICRFGGEEFVLLLPDSTPTDAERLTRLITTRFQMLATLPDFTTTASYGLASTEDGADLELLIERADQALYRAKETGRDRAVHFTALAS